MDKIACVYVTGRLKVGDGRWIMGRGGRATAGEGIAATMTKGSKGEKIMRTIWSR